MLWDGLKTMLRDEPSCRQARAFCLLQKVNLRRGTIQGHPDGLAFYT